ncbi:ABC transporter permease [Pontibacter anaerobius]|uniref:ABC transporter permease n=1 Tax=Pontibacter anaerobius TaxID=2993940 RepID=A0ABT3RDI8_9BACT|nr:ABC transporter permease [Pontibacter anaerobius]MCX2739491.1 ABC transporter permease [Pontibacter anaerobius]
MTKNYLKMAYRNLMRHKVFSLINISGLALGMTCSILILLWVQDEVSFDRFHDKIERVYQVMEVQSYPGAGDFETQATPGQLAEAMQQELPEVEQAIRYTWPMPMLLSHGELGFKGQATYAEQQFFEVFSFPLIQGDAKQALQQPNSVVISDSMAYKLFGSTDVVGKLLKLNNAESYKVTGVMAAVPRNSSMQFDYVMPIEDYVRKPENEWLKHWGNNGLMTYLLLKPGIDVAAFDKKIGPFIKQRYEASNVELFLHPYGDLHLYSFQKSGSNPGMILYVRIFAVVAIFLLVIACINFMNLATARSAKRAKEVGVRKAIGAHKSSLISQFIIESMLVAFIALFLAMNLTGMLLPYFNDFTGKEIQFDLTDPSLLLLLLGVTLFTGLVSGSYPAFFLSSFNPALVLKGTVKLNKGVANFRKGLVVFQFSLSALLIVSTLVVALQLHYIRNRNIGMNRENVLSVELEGNLQKKYDVVKRELMEVPGVLAVSAANRNPIAISHNTGDVKWKGKEVNADILVDVMDVDFGFLEMMEIELKEGRAFSEDFGKDSTAFIINEEAARQMNMKEPVGQWLSIWNEGHIVGVVKDFHSSSLHGKTKPLAMRVRPEEVSAMFVRVAGGQTEQVLAEMERIAKQHNPAFPFQYRFLDEQYEQMYRSEAMMGKLTTAFASIAIFISCLGLFGLALFTAEQRTKEIGIRKVLGASVSGIVFMLSKDFLKLVLVANLVALPLGWYFMSGWLNDYAYRTELSWWIFALAFVATIIIALVTLSFHAVKTAVANPINSLRAE